MRRSWRRLGLPALAAALVAVLNLAPVSAQGTYTGGGYTFGAGGMPYQAPARSAGPVYPAAPSYQSPSAGYSANSMQHGAFVRYVVRRGDTLARIAARFGVSQLALLRANPAIKNPNRVLEGQILFIPFRSSGSSGHGDNRHNADDKRAVLYTVHFGDTLARIARRFGTSVTAILRANPSVVDPDLVFAGQTLVIPVASSGAKYGAGALYSPPPRTGYPTAKNAMPPMARLGPYGMPAPAPAPMPAPVPGPQTATVNLTARNMAFSLSTITVPAGAQVVVNFDNQDAGVPHNLAVYTDSSAQQAIFRGQIITGPGRTTYSFTAPSQPGTYFFRCDVHFTMMTGQFVVR